MLKQPTPPPSRKAAEALVKKRHGQRDAAVKLLGELEDKLAEAKKTLVEAGAAVKCSEAALGVATERDRNSETCVSAIAKLVENALRRATGARVGGAAAEREGAAASSGAASEAEVPLEEVVGLVKGKVDEILRALERGKQARAAERGAGAGRGPEVGQSLDEPAESDPRFIDAEMGLPRDQLAVAVDRKWAAKREQLLAANALAAKKATAGP